MQSIRIKLILIPLVLIIFFLALAAMTYWHTQEMEGGAAAINMAGKQRMLTQMITKEALEIKFYPDEGILHIEELKSAIVTFDQSLQALINGNAELNIPPPQSPKILNKLIDISSFWNGLKTSLAIILNYENIEKEEFMNAINVISRADYDLLEMTDSIVKLYEMESNKKVDTVLKILSWSVPTVLIIMILGWRLANRWIVSPLVKVSEFLKERKTLEDYREKVPFHFNNEIGIMIDAINEAGERVVNLTDTLKASETRYKNLVGAAEDAIITINDKGNIILFNKSAEKLFGYKDLEAMEKNITVLMPEEFRDAHKKGLKRFCETGKPKIIGKPVEVVGLSKQGKRILIELSISAVKTEKEYIFTGIIRDIRERKKYEVGIRKKNEELQRAYDDLKQAQSQLLQVEKMASIGQLAAGVAHEINNPIGFINSNLSVLGGYGKDLKKVFEKIQKLRSFRQIQGHINMAQSDSNTAQDARNIQEIWKELDDLIQEIDLEYLLNDLDNVIKESQEGTERVKKIVKDLRDFSHPGEPELKYGDVNKGLESTLNIVQNEIKYKAEVIKDFGELPEILCYPMQLNQVFMNIFINAAQSIVKEGKIRIVTRNLKNNFIEVSISDTGTGISRENLDKIFNPFFTTKKVGEGTGLGLSMAYGIIQKHGGTIQVESEEGKGSSFIITLPVRGSAKE